MPSTLRQRRNEERKVRTREALLDAAQHTFVEQGFHKTLVSDVVARAGVGQGTFYRHFSDKPAVFAALLERMVGALLAKFEPMSSQLPTNLEEYRAASLSAVGQVAAFVEENRELVLMLQREAPAIGGPLEERLQGVYDQFATLAQFYLDHAIAQGFARPCRSEIIAQAIVGMALRTATLLGRDTEQRFDVQAVAEEIVTFAFVGFGPTSAQPTLQ